MSQVYDLSALGPEAFENLMNFLALKTLGMGSTGFGPGADGGRDGYFEGEAPYPSEAERWKGIWYIQSKFHRPHLSKDPQKWLIQQVTEEIRNYQHEGSKRAWPDNWIIATNIDPSAAPETGSFDAIKRLVKKSGAPRRVNLHVWGGRKILDLLSIYSDVANHFRQFLSPGHVLAALYDELADTRGSMEDVIRYFVATQFSEQLFTKLDQANSSSDVRPRVHDLFMDLPYRACTGSSGNGLLLDLSRASAQSHRYSTRREFPESWREWGRQIPRARVYLVKGGPGQGKSTVGQYLSQIHRSCLLLAPDGPRVTEGARNSAQAVRSAAIRDGFWPTAPRIPIQIELKEFAHWYSRRTADQARTVLSFLAESVTKKISSDVLPKTLKRALSKHAWILVFDGLDEVPNDFKDDVAKEVIYFLNDQVIEIDADVLALCTSRPQGYSGQFSELDGPIVDLVQLDADAAMRCAIPLLSFERTSEEAQTSIETLEAAIRSPSVRELMTTPLQSHIMAVVVRDGGRPPERRWQLFNSFYLVMKKRESLKNFQNPTIARLLREEDRLLKAVHSRLGFILHARAERSDGAQTTLSRKEFKLLVQDVVSEIVDHEIEDTVSAVMEATTERLVLVNTPESGNEVRFDIRQLQEFFAAEFIYAGVDAHELAMRIETIGGDAHWREVMHFLLSALIESQRPVDVSVAVQTLRKLNEGDEGSCGTLLQRRMARGSLLAIRLLGEGVLEDSRDRQQIRPLLDPVGGFINLHLLKTVVGSLRPTRSRQWFISFLLEKISTASPREHVAALALLGWMLPDKHADNALARAAFFNCSMPFQEILISHWQPHISLEFYSKSYYETDQIRPIAEWVLGVAVRILGSPSWGTYPCRTLESLLKICVSEMDRLKEALKASGIDDASAEVICRCISLYEVQKPHTHTRGVNLGLIDARRYTENWTNRKVPLALKGIDNSAGSTELHGAFRAMVTCAWFANERGSQPLVEIAHIARAAGLARLRLLPGALLALVPIPTQFSCSRSDLAYLERANQISVSELVQELATQLDPPYAHLTLASGSKAPADEQWRVVACKLPRIAISLAFDHEDLPRRIEARFVPELISVIESNPEVAVRHILKWGTLTERQPQLLDHLKQSALNLPDYKSDHWSVSVRKIHPFELQLPSDMHLLRSLAPALVEARRHRSVDISQNFSQIRDGSLHAILQSYGLHAQSLCDLAESDSLDPRVNAAAAALYWLLLAEQPELGRSRVSLRKERALYERLITPINESWLTFALVRGVLMDTDEADSTACSLVDCLLERTLDSPGPRDELVELLETWRERSTAPVHARQVLEKWLDYSYKPIPHSARS